MGSTFLTLTNLVLSRINEVPLTAANFATATGIHGTAKNAINASIRQINQEEFEWPFNVQAGSQILTGLPVPDQLYPLPSDYKAIDWHTFYLERLPSENQEGSFLRLIPYEEWVQYRRTIDEEIIATAQTGDKYVPVRIFRTPDEQFGVTPPPTAAFTVKFTYWNVPVDLTADTDTTTIPSRFNHIIVEGAMTHMGLFKDNFEATQIHRDTFKRGISNMRTQLVNKQYERVFDLRTNNSLRRS